MLLLANLNVLTKSSGPIKTFLKSASTLEKIELYFERLRDLEDVKDYELEETISALRSLLPASYVETLASIVHKLESQDLPTSSNGAGGNIANTANFYFSDD